MIPLSELDIRKAAIASHVEGGSGFQRILESLDIRVESPLRGPLLNNFIG